MRVRSVTAGGRRRQISKQFRGSRKRLRRIRARDNWSVEFVIFIIFMLFVLLVLVPWMVTHPHRH
jgi:hypothetical protein